MNCIIIDDEATARVIVRQLCSKVPQFDIIEEFDNTICNQVFKPTRYRCGFLGYSYDGV